MKHYCTICHTIHEGRCERPAYFNRKRNSEADRFRNTQKWRKKAASIQQRDLYCCRVCLKAGQINNRELSGCYGVSAVRCDAAGGSGNHISDPTAARAERAIRLSADIDAIDKALELTADEPIRLYIKRAVTSGLKYEYLGQVPMGRQQFYEARRKFFYNLKILKKG